MLNSDQEIARLTHERDQYRTVLDAMEFNIIDKIIEGNRADARALGKPAKVRMVETEAENAALKKENQSLAESLDNIRAELGLESTHYLILNLEVRDRIAALKVALRELVEAGRNVMGLIDNQYVRNEVKAPFLNAHIRASGLLRTHAEAAIKEES